MSLAQYDQNLTSGKKFCPYETKTPIKRGLRILRRKTHYQIKLKRLRNVQTRIFGELS